MSVVVTETLPPGPPRLPTAKRLRKQNVASGNSEAADFLVVCPRCGDRFVLSPEVWAVNTGDIAARYAAWLLDGFVWDHIQENKHRSSITLPTADELVRWTQTNAR